MSRVESSQSLGIATGWTMEEAVLDLRTTQETLLLSIAPIWFRCSQNLPINVY